METKKSEKLPWLNKILWIGFAIIACALIATIYFFHQFNVRLQLEKQGEMQQKVIDLAVQLNHDLTTAVENAELMAKNIQNGKLTRGQFLSYIEEKLKNYPAIFGIGVSYAPYLEPKYLRNNNHYYLNQLKINNPEPSRYLPVVTIPINSLDQKNLTHPKIGEVFVDLDLVSFKKLMEELKLSKIGYSFLVDKNGAFLDYPISSYITHKKTLFNLAAEQGNRELLSLAKLINEGASGSFGSKDYFSGESAWTFYQNLPVMGWTLGVVLLDVNQTEQDLTNAKIFRVSLLIEAMLLLTLLTTAILSPYLKKNILRKWLWSMLITIIMILGIVTVWSQHMYTQERYSKNETMVLDEASLHTLTAQFLKNVSNSFIIQIPTGIQIEKMTFLNNNNIALSGYVWQKVSSQENSNLFAGVDFPQTTSSAMEKIYNSSYGLTNIIGWSFNAIILQKMDFTKYPFDSLRINLQMSPKYFDKNIVLVPDLNAYPLINPSYLPGASSIKLSGWSTIKSFFSYKFIADKNYEETASSANYLLNYPRLEFNIIVQRHFLQTLIVSIIPVLAMLIILFFLLISMVHVKVFQYLTACSASIFTIVLMHMSFRSSIATDKIIYFDYFFILLYLATLLFAIEAFIREYFKKIGHPVSHDNLLSQLLFLPLFTLTMFVITLLVFY